MYFPVCRIFFENFRGIPSSEKWKNVLFEKKFSFSRRNGIMAFLEEMPRRKKNFRLLGDSINEDKEFGGE